MIHGDASWAMLLHAMDDSEDCDEKESSPIHCAFDVSSAELLRALDATDNDIQQTMTESIHNQYKITGRIEPSDH
jgi:hypothetical protein